MASLAALVPKPRAHLTRYHGVFAPASPERARFAPATRTVAADRASQHASATAGERARIHRWVERLPAQEWWAVAIELLIVIVGLFLSLRLKEWWEAREDRALDGDTPAPDARQLSDALCRWFVRAPQDLRRGTYAELLSSGRLVLLRDARLRELPELAERSYEAIASSASSHDSRRTRWKPSTACSSGSIAWGCGASRARRRALAPPAVEFRTGLPNRAPAGKNSAAYAVGTQTGCPKVVDDPVG